MEQRRNVLVVAPGADQFERIAPPLLRRAFEVDRIPSARGAVELLSQVPFAAVIARFPVADMAAADLLAAIHAPESATRGTAVALVADGAAVADARKLIGKGATMVVSLEDPLEQRDDLLCQMLGVHPRRSVRVLVKLDVHLSGDHDRFFAQMENLSATGMMVGTTKRHPLGSTTRFEFLLHGHPRPFSGSAEVVRHASPPRDRCNGMGYRFTSLDGNRQADLERYLLRRGHES